MNQDDPKKCTALKLVRLGLVKKISLRQVSKNALLLNPMSTEIICKTDAKHLNSGLVVIDCSWKEEIGIKFKKGTGIFKKRLPGINKRLPILQAGNPTNYSKLFTLSSSEALAASLFITGRQEESELVLSKFKWGHTFFELNSDILDDYCKANTSDEIAITEKKYYEKFL
ncbi:MAG: DUF367 family protein [Thaumarchaeota archaeon]|jgi:pre-rRNA-processing protein TSR3|nr:DUF367 family protein [Nitrososphaerota archaeon]